MTKKHKKQKAPAQVENAKALGAQRVKTTKFEQQLQISSGPLPPPQQYSDYEAILKGAADRILSMAENVQRHRIYCEQTALRKNSKASSLGQVFGLTIVVLCILSAVFCAYIDQPWVSAILAGGTAINLLSLFIGKK